MHATTKNTPNRRSVTPKQFPAERAPRGCEFFHVHPTSVTIEARRAKLQKRNVPCHLPLGVSFCAQAKCTCDVQNVFGREEARKARLKPNERYIASSVRIGTRNTGRSAPKGEGGRRREKRRGEREGGRQCDGGCASTTACVGSAVSRATRVS